MARRIWMAAAAVAIFALGWGAGVGFFYLQGRIFPASFSASSPPPAGSSEAQAGRPAPGEGQGEGANPAREPATPSPRQLDLAKLSVATWAPDGALQWELRAESVEGSQSGEDAVLQDVEGVLYTGEGPVRVWARRGEVDGRRQRVLFQGQVAVQVLVPGSARPDRTAAGSEPAASEGAGAAAGEEMELRAAELEHDQRSGLLVARGT
ncbi:MAG: LPS export ABC transporter periplasmic protein LptC, partial [Bacillota bacterium]|nr:LPS export ABC transporter periplasmic protein LptC [Bacillota bacterium]